MKTHFLGIGACASLIGFLAGLPSRPIVPDRLCTLMPFGNLKTDSQPYFLGVVLPESTVAGPGSRPVRVAQGHFGPAREGPIYGQMVRIERWGGNAPALARVSSDTVVVVPWDYGADCATTPWARSWLWLRPGARFFFTPQLRPPMLWAASRPTFDAYAPQFEAYPPDYPDPAFGRAPEGLTADQLFDLFEQVPSRESIATSDWQAIQGVLDWARTHPDLARTYPADQIGLVLTLAAGESHARKIPPLVAGTYHFNLTYPDGHRREFYLRTGDRPSGAWIVVHPDTPQDEPPVRPWSRQLDGYELNAWVARQESQLPTYPDWTRRYDFPMGIREAAESTGQTVSWRAEFETSGLGLFKVLNDPELDSLMSRHFSWFAKQWDAGTLIGDPGRFTRDAHGGVTFEQRVPLDDGRAILITAKRVSLRTVRDTTVLARW